MFSHIPRGLTGNPPRPVKNDCLDVGCADIEEAEAEVAEASRDGRRGRAPGAVVSDLIPSGPFARRVAAAVGSNMGESRSRQIGDFKHLHRGTPAIVLDMWTAELLTMYTELSYDRLRLERPRGERHLDLDLSSWPS